MSLWLLITSKIHLMNSFDEIRFSSSWSRKTKKPPGCSKNDMLSHPTHWCELKETILQIFAFHVLRWQRVDSFKLTGLNSCHIDKGENFRSLSEWEDMYNFIMTVVSEQVCWKTSCHLDSLFNQKLLKLIRSLWHTLWQTYLFNKCYG